MFNLKKYKYPFIMSYIELLYREKEMDKELYERLMDILMDCEVEK